MFHLRAPQVGPRAATRQNARARAPRSPSYALAAVALALLAACGASSKTGFDTSTFAGEDAGAAGPSGAGAPGTFSAADGGEAPVIPDDAACAAVREAAVSTPVNLFIMFDKSSSQAGSKWEAAKAGLKAFLDEPRSAGIRAALGLFPRPIDATPSCDQAAYKTPRVPFGVLPGNAPALMAVLAAETPNGPDTPIYPALGGALLGAIAEAQARPGESAAVLLVTDGEPAGPAPRCGGVNPEDAAEIAKLAESGARFSPAVRTFVIGLPGVPPAIANQIAAAGGTQRAYIVASTSVQAEFQKALSAVRGQALPCDFVLPPKLEDKSFAYDKVNVAVTRSGAAGAETLPQSPACSGMGWRYDDPADPKRIVLCPEACAALREDFGARVDILLGCATILR